MIGTSVMKESEKWLLMRFILPVVLERTVTITADIVSEEYITVCQITNGWVLNMLRYYLGKFMLKVNYKWSVQRQITQFVVLQNERKKSKWLQKIGRACTSCLPPCKSAYVVANSRYENFCFTINEPLKMLLCLFLYFHFPNFNITFVKYVMINYHFFNENLQTFSKVTLCRKSFVFGKFWK